MMKRCSDYYAVILILFLLAGCKVSKDVFVSPEAPATYRNAFASDTATIADWEWKRFFSDKKLQVLINAAIAGNHDLQIAFRNVENAKLILRQSKWGQIPQLNSYISSSTSITSENSLNGLSIKNFLGTRHIEDYNLGLSLSW